MNNKSQTLGQVVFFEHINVENEDQGTAITFYIEGLGFTRDPFQRTFADNIWINIGSSQIHSPTNKKKPGEVIPGHMGIVVPNLDHIVAGLKRVTPKLAGTKFAFSETHIKDTESLYINKGTKVLDVTCPYGNKFFIFENTPEFNYKGGLGMPYVELRCAPGTAAKIATFYEKYLGARVECDVLMNPVFARIFVGPHQQLIYRESTEAVNYDTYHVCIYVSDFSGMYDKLSKDDLLYHKHKYPDTFANLEQALAVSQFRIKTIVDPDDVTKGSIYELEHEVRSLYHPYYLRPLVNKTGTYGIYCSS